MGHSVILFSKGYDEFSQLSNLSGFVYLLSCSIMCYHAAI